MNKVSSLLIRAVERWVAEFKRGQTSLEDGPCDGRLKSALTPKIVATHRIWFCKFERVTERDLIEAQGNSLRYVSGIFAEILGFRTMCA